MFFGGFSEVFGAIEDLAPDWLDLAISRQIARIRSQGCARARALHF